MGFPMLSSPFFWTQCLNHIPLEEAFWVEHTQAMKRDCCSQNVSCNKGSILGWHVSGCVFLVCECWRILWFSGFESGTCRDIAVGTGGICGFTFHIPNPQHSMCARAYQVSVVSCFLFHKGDSSYSFQILVLGIPTIPEYIYLEKNKCLWPWNCHLPSSHLKFLQDRLIPSKLQECIYSWEADWQQEHSHHLIVVLYSCLHTGKAVLPLSLPSACSSTWLCTAPFSTLVFSYCTGN